MGYAPRQRANYSPNSPIQRHIRFQWIDQREEEEAEEEAHERRHNNSNATTMPQWGKVALLKLISAINWTTQMTNCKNNSNNNNNWQKLCTTCQLPPPLRPAHPLSLSLSLALAAKTCLEFTLSCTRFQLASVAWKRQKMFSFCSNCSSLFSLPLSLFLLSVSFCSLCPLILPVFAPANCHGQGRRLLTVDCCDMAQWFVVYRLCEPHKLRLHA